MTPAQRRLERARNRERKKRNKDKEKPIVSELRRLKHHGRACNKNRFKQIVNGHIMAIKKEMAESRQP